MNAVMATPTAPANAWVADFLANSRYEMKAKAVTLAATAETIEFFEKAQSTKNTNPGAIDSTIPSEPPIPLMSDFALKLTLSESELIASPNRFAAPSR